MRSLAEVARDFDPVGMARRLASELAASGWQEDERGLWSNGGEWMHLLDAHALMKGRKT